MALRLIKFLRPRRLQELLIVSRSNPPTSLCQVFNRELSTISKNSSFLAAANYNKNFHRFCYKKNKKGKNTADEDEDSDDELQKYADDVDKSKIAKIRVQSLRIDLLIKSALSIPRNKIEVAFYEGKIRLNGKKIIKKSAHCNVGDVIDVIKNDSPTNPEHIIVARLELLDVKTDGEEFIYVTMKRFRNLTVSKDDLS